jgi:hypothetical protein
LTTKDRFVRVTFYDHDYEDSNSGVEPTAEPTVLCVTGRVVAEDPLRIVVSTCDNLGGRNTRFGGAPMTLFRVLRSAIIEVLDLRPVRPKKKVSP